MRILFWSDLHAHVHRPFARYEDGINTRLRDALRIIDQVTEVAKDCDYTVFLGDLFHISPPPAPAFNETYERIKKLAAMKTLFMLAGNHDLRSKYYNGDPRDIPFLKFLSFDTVRIFEVGKTSTSITLDPTGEKVSVFGFNHRREADAAELVKGADPHDILVMHQEVFGADNEFGYTFRGGMHPDDLKKFRWVFTGHIHKPQILNDRVVVVGAPLHIDFGDVGDRGMFILDTEKDDVEVVDTKFPRFVTLGRDEEAPDDDNFYRSEQAKEKKREALKIPDWEEAIGEYCRQQKHTEYIDAGRKIVDATPKELIAPQPFSIARVELSNFGVFTEAKYDIDSGLHMVIGDIMGGEGRSNGAGKTTLFEGISWVIYGRTSKGVRGASVMKRDRKRGKLCKGVVVLTSPKGELRIERVQKASGSTLEAWFGDHHEEGRVPEVQAWIAETLGVGYEFFQQMVYFSQEQAEFFSEMGDADRKKILGTLLGTRWYEAAEQEAKDCRDATRELLNTARSDLKHGKAVLNTIVEERDAAEVSVGQWKSRHEKALEAAEAEVERSEAWLQKAESDVDGDRANILENKERELVDAAAGHKKAVAGLETREKLKLREATKRFEDRSGDIEKSLGQLRKKRETFGPSAAMEGAVEQAEAGLKEHRSHEKKIISSISSARSAKDQLDKQATTLRKKIEAVEKLETGVQCQTCGADITEDSRNRCVDEMRRELNPIRVQSAEKAKALSVDEGRLDVIRKEIENLEGSLENARMAVTGAERLDTKISNLVGEGEGLRAQHEAALGRSRAEFQAERAELDKDDDALRARITKKYDDEIARIERTKQAEVARLEEKVKQARTEIKRLTKEENPYVEARDRNTTAAAKQERENTKLSAEVLHHGDQVEVFTFWVAGFGREGIRAALLHNFCRVFTGEVNDTLTQMGIGMSAALSPSTELKSKKGEVRDRLSYKITTATGEMAYQELSGGEKVRIDLASMLALNLIASRHFGIEDGLFGILVLDEIFSSLDEAGVEVVYQIINGFTARSIYVISHDPSMKSMFDRVLTVLRDGTDSVLVI